MSLCRRSDGDLYIYLTPLGLYECNECPQGNNGLMTRKQILIHLRTHSKARDVFPAKVIDELIHEGAN